LGGEASQVLPFSTGVIGERLPLSAFEAASASLVNTLGSKDWLDAALAIMTTDTRPKIASRQLTFGGKTVSITGVAKGAGMIQPNMATMLSFIGSDAKIAPATLQLMLSEATRLSFNRITVDSDTSTNDAVVLMATGQSMVTVDANEQDLLEFQDALTDLMLELAHGLVRDAEGATKFVTVEVNKASTPEQALEIAYSVANSPLMKTAVFASDANWGRLAMAVGKVPTAFDANLVDLYIGDVCLMKGGIRNTEYREADGAAVMAEEEILLRIDLNAGDHGETVWTSDLSHDYIRINAEYRT
jgi:glutamate N-acetyltransferase/amino-acid N-acetyltransferase